MEITAKEDSSHEPVWLINPLNVKILN